MLADLIKERMAALGINQRELARRSGLSPQYISDLINNRRAGRISVLTQVKLARGLRVTERRVANCVATADLMSANADMRLASAGA